MTRKWFLGLFGIGAAGQQIQDAYPIYTIPKYTLPGGSNLPKHSNGECPVCGTMAPKYFAQSARVLTVIPPVHVPGEPDSKIVRCSHCNDAFWQDAEGVR